MILTALDEKWILMEFVSRLIIKYEYGFKQKMSTCSMSKLMVFRRGADFGQTFSLHLA